PTPLFPYTNALPILPSLKCGKSNVNLYILVCKSTPTVLIIKPILIAIKPLTIFPRDKVTIAESVNKNNKKYSCGPNFNANSDNGLAKIINPITAIMPPNKEAMAEIVSALPASPFLVIGYTSNVAAVADPQPGVFSKIELLEPPYIAPKYIETIKINALTGSIPKVTGINTATAVAGPNPGNIPTTVPKNPPIKTQ